MSDTRESLGELGSALAAWCLNSPSDEIVAATLNPDNLFYGANDLPRLRFTFVLANTAVAIIALNDILRTTAPVAVDVFHKKFLELSKSQHARDVMIGDYIRSASELRILEGSLQPPKGASIQHVKMNLHSLIEIMQDVRLQAYMAAYSKGTEEGEIFGKMAQFAESFVRHFVGDNAFDDPQSKAGVMSLLLAHSFSLRLVVFTRLVLEAKGKLARE